MKLPKITNKQQEILALLYRYRYLNREQIQALMNHKDRKTINMWLRDLREKEYIGWIYSDHFAEKTKPAIYFIAVIGVRWLKTLTDEDGDYRYPLEDIRKRYRDSGRSSAFVTRCTAISQCAVDCYTKNSPEVRYGCATQADFRIPAHSLHFLIDGDLESQLGPHLYIKRYRGKRINTFLLEFFDTGLPRYRLSKRLRQYIRFYTDGDWEAYREQDPLPTVLLVCPRTTDLIYAKRKTRGLLAERWDKDDDDRPRIQFTTAEQLSAEGVLGGIWEKA